MDNAIAQPRGSTVSAGPSTEAQMFSYFQKKSIASLVVKLPREELLRRSRILIIDDEKPDLFLEDLQRARFAAEHVPDITKNNIDIIDRPVHDLILLDFGNVGR